MVIATQKGAGRGRVQYCCQHYRGSARRLLIALAQITTENTDAAY
jgi:hypothetical protein